MQEESQTEASSPNEKQPRKLKERHEVESVTVIKRSKINNYPYYPVTFCMNQNQIGYVFCLDFLGEEYVLSVTPFKFAKDKSNHVQMSASIVELGCLPKRNVNLLYVLSYQDSMGQNGKNMIIEHMDFVVGFSAGFLILCRYTYTRSRGSQSKK